MKNKLIPKHQKAGKLLKNEPVQDGTYIEQPRLNLQEQELLNFIQSNPTPEQVYFRDLAIKNGESPVLQEVLEEAEKDNAKNNFFRGYNNFRYSHPWAKGLNWTPVVGDVMDGVSLAGDINNKNYINAAIGLGLMALPNFILKPLLKYGKLLNIPDDVWDDLYNKAIKNNNLEEVRQLRDLHFKAKAPNTKLKEIYYHGSPEKNINIFNNKKYFSIDKNSEWTYSKDLNDYKKVGYKITKQMEDDYNQGKPIVISEKPVATYLTPNIPLANTYRPNYLGKKSGKLYNLRVNAPDIYTIDALHKPWNFINIDENNVVSTTDLENWYRNKKDAVLIKNVMDSGGKDLYGDPVWGDVIINYDNTKIKSADAITYDDNNRIIPLSKRDNFNNPDIRYSLIVPISFGTASYKFQKEKEKHKQGGIFKYKSGKPITETPRDNTNYERKTSLVKKKNNYSSYEEIVDAKVNEKLEENKPILKKHTRPVPAWPVGGKRKA